MKNRIKLKQGDLCLFNFSPGVGHEFQGKRPALVIQSDEQINRSNLVTVIPLTSNVNNCLDDDIIVEHDNRNRLFSDSVIKVYNIVSVDYNRFIKKIGYIEKNIFKTVKEYLKKHFEI